MWVESDNNINSKQLQTSFLTTTILLFFAKYLCKIHSIFPTRWVSGYTTEMARTISEKEIYDKLKYPIQTRVAGKQQETTTINLRRKQELGRVRVTTEAIQLFLTSKKIGRQTYRRDWNEFLVRAVFQTEGYHPSVSLNLYWKPYSVTKKCFVYYCLICGTRKKSGVFQLAIIQYTNYWHCKSTKYACIWKFTLNTFFRQSLID